MGWGGGRKNERSARATRGRPRRSRRLAGRWEPRRGDSARVRGMPRLTYQRGKGLENGDTESEK